MKIFLLLIISTFLVVYGKQKPPACLIQPAKNFESDRNTRIAGGEAAPKGKFPWHVHMSLYDDLKLKICGGALINSKWVLTSGTCLVCTNSAILYFGIVDRLSFEVPWMTAVTNYDHFIVHEGYDIMNFEDPFADNIGLVFLERGGNFLLDIPNIKVIDLPINYRDRDFVGDLGLVAGFGATVDPPTHSSRFLKFIDMAIMNNDECNEFFKGAITDTKLCTNTAGGRSTCHGDFGAPLTANVLNQDILVGVGSLRYFGGCTVGAPAVFTRVTKYLDWIKDNTNGEPEDSDDCVCDCICHTCPAVDLTKNEL